MCHFWVNNCIVLSWAGFGSHSGLETAPEYDRNTRIGATPSDGGFRIVQRLKRRTTKNNIRPIFARSKYVHNTVPTTNGAVLHHTHGEMKTTQSLSTAANVPHERCRGMRVQ